MNLRSPIFKGCTRPAMALGVPLEVLVLVLLPLAVLFIVGFMMFKPLAFVAGVLLIAAYISMRELSRRDDQRLKQQLLRILLSGRQGNRGFWGALSYSPRRFRRFRN